MTEPGQVLGISKLDEHVLLGDAGLAMAMVAAGAERLAAANDLPATPLSAGGP